MKLWRQKVIWIPSDKIVIGFCPLWSVAAKCNLSQLYGADWAFPPVYFNEYFNEIKDWSGLELLWPHIFTPTHTNKKKRAREWKRWSCIYFKLTCFLHVSKHINSKHTNNHFKKFFFCKGQGKMKEEEEQVETSVNDNHRARNERTAQWRRSQYRGHHWTCVLRSPLQCRVYRWAHVIQLASIPNIQFTDWKDNKHVVVILNKKRRDRERSLKKKSSKCR